MYRDTSWVERDERGRFVLLQRIAIHTAAHTATHTATQIESNHERSDTPLIDHLVMREFVSGPSLL